MDHDDISHELDMEAFKYFDTNKFALANKDRSKLRSFSVATVPKGSYNGRSLGIRRIYTPMYKIKNEKSNVFNIDIPELTYEFITYLRLRNDFIKIIDKNTLEWDGNKYIRIK